FRFLSRGCNSGGTACLQYRKRFDEVGSEFGELIINSQKHAWHTLHSKNQASFDLRAAVLRNHHTIYFLFVTRQPPPKQSRGDKPYIPRDHRFSCTRSTHWLGFLKHV